MEFASTPNPSTTQRRVKVRASRMHGVALLLAAAAGLHMVASDATNATPPIYAIAGFGGSGTRAVRV